MRGSPLGGRLIAGVAVSTPKSRYTRPPAGRSGRFSRLVYKVRYVNADSLLRIHPNFGMGRAKRGAKLRKNETESPNTQKTRTEAQERNQQQTNTNYEEKRNRHTRREGPKKPEVRTNATAATPNPKRALILRGNETAAELHCGIPLPDAPVCKQGGHPSPRGHVTVRSGMTVGARSKRMIAHIQEKMTHPWNMGG